MTKTLFYDLEAVGFAANADILQVSITKVDFDGPDSYLSLHVMPKKKITPHNVGSVLWRLFSTLEVVQYIEGITSVLWGDNISTVGG